MKVRMIRLGGVLLAVTVMFATFLPGATHPVRAAATDLIISEYVEGTGADDQAIEIYNGTGADVDLTDYVLEIYPAGSPLPNDFDLSTLGVITNDSVIVIAHPNAHVDILDWADDTNTAIDWSGDDVIALVNNGTNIDVIGQIGTDPGTGWTVGSGSTSNHILIRNPDVCTGDNNGSNVFNGNGEWTAIDANDPDPFADLGVHTSTCLDGTGGSEELFISEYIEGTSNNKAIEIYNGTGGNIDLSQYSLQLFSDGAVAASQSLSLSGLLADDTVYVVAHPSADAEILDIADDTNGAVINFNGDDAFALFKTGTGYIDVIGQVGFDPGTSWGVGTGFTQNNTLVRKSTVCEGDFIHNDVFNGNNEWDVFAQDTFDDLGFHLSECIPPGPEPDVIVNINESDDPITVDDTVTYTFTVTNEGTDNAENVELVALFGGTAGWDFDTTPGAGCSFTDVDELTCDVGTVVNGVPYETTMAVNATSTGNITVDASVVADAPEIDTNNDDSETTTVNEGVVCGNPTAETYDLQENGANFGQAGPFTVVGIVTGDFQGDSSLAGFYIQDATGDGNANTSDGIFVSDPDPAILAVIPGRRVEVTGEVSEVGTPPNTLTTITATTVIDCGDTGTITPTAVTLPIGDLLDWEDYEGMLVTLSGSTNSLTVTETYNLGRFGEIIVANGVLFNPTEQQIPDSAAFHMMRDLNERSSIIIDDTLSSIDLSDLPYLHNTPETLRRGDTVPSITGVLETRFGDFRVQPTQAVTFTAVNTRSASPASVGGNVKIASFNVLNYFTTLDNGSNGARGADSANEFDRQESKIVTALAAINADVFGLMEIENNGAAVNALVAALNAEIGGIPYAAISTGVVGTDAIAVAMIYKPATVTPIGSEVTITTGPFASLSRPPIAQVFEHNATGEQFIVVVNHFKSKSCDGATGLNTDQDDGQGCYNQARIEAATALDAWLDSDPTGTGITDILIIGDLNAYSQEDPITTLEGAGYVNLTADLDDADRYSYVFEGAAGVLDHAFGTASLDSKITDITIWKINSDEPRSLDYNDNISDNGSDIRNNDTSLYVDNPFRASDHDPVIVGLNIVETGDPEPGAFTLLEPVDNIFVRSLQNFPALKWTVSTNAASYDVVFYKLSGNTRAEIVNIGVNAAECTATECSLTLTPILQELFSNGTYVWTVIAISGAETLEASNAGFRFVLNTGEIELVKNNQFEGKPSNTKVPPGWFKVGKLINDKIRCDSETQTFAHTGSCAYVLTGAKSEGVSGIRQTLKLGRYRLVTGDKLAMSAWVTQKSGKSGQVVLLLTVTYKNKNLGNNGKVTALIKLPANATPGYVEMLGNREITLAGAVKSIVVKVQYGAATGQVYIDDVSVVILPVDTPAPLENEGEVPVPAAPLELRDGS